MNNYEKMTFTELTKGVKTMGDSSSILDIRGCELHWKCMHFFHLFYTYYISLAIINMYY